MKNGTEIIRGKPIYSVKNEKNELLNVRISDVDNNIIWNAYRDKRFWIANDIYQAITQAALINTKEGENARVVEIVEVQTIINLKAEEGDILENKQMKTGDKLQIVQDDNGVTLLRFVAAHNESHKTFSLGDAMEALKYLLLDEEGRKAKNED